MSDPPAASPLPTPPKTSATAIWALITGLLFIPLLPVILGLVALSKINSSGGRLTGGGMGIAGIILGGIGALVALLAALAAPVIFKAHNRANLMEATNNARNLGIFMHEFEDEWGTYPSEQILRENPERFAGARPGESSNALLSMLVAGGYTNSEAIFFANGGAASSKKPDNLTTPPSRLLEPGECGFGYVMVKGGRAQRTSDNGGRPLLVAPLLPGQGGSPPRFNEAPYNGKILCLRIDQSVNRHPTDEATGQAMLPGGGSLFQTGADTVWQGDVPDVRLPE